MKIEQHEQALEEHIRNLNKSIDEGIEENQRNIGYNASQGSIELFAIYLHSLHIIESSGDQWDHRVFKSKSKIEEKVPAEFNGREKVLELMTAIENERNALCYGKRKPKARIEKMINSFQELRELIVGLKNNNDKSGKND